MEKTNLYIVNSFRNEVYSVCIGGKTADEEVKAASAYYKDQVKRIAEISAKYPGPYWTGRLSEAESLAASKIEVLTWEEWYARERRRVLTGRVKVVTEEEWNRQLNVLPPSSWCEYDGMEVFCMSERYTLTFTAQYARDPFSGKFYTAMVDEMDRDTWIPNLLKRQRENQAA